MHRCTEQPDTDAAKTSAIVLRHPTVQRTVRACALLAPLILATGCATYEPHMMPAPVVFKDDQLDFTPRLPPALRTTHVPVFYAGIRTPTNWPSQSSAEPRILP